MRPFCVAVPSSLTASVSSPLRTTGGCCPPSCGSSIPRSRAAGSRTGCSPGQHLDRQDALQATPELLRYAAAIISG
ncbi:hypothetical protein NDU88_002265 [Pleurodeles waltl]|uniref:Uncharacterized protein n=1 Tax=Pleurodeles waltl TaxID=8319 RepID=A0AAV7PB54_PLEWA|nr:hypothetical protein NDU88_002265 [Pleurodeles waltl]